MKRENTRRFVLAVVLAAALCLAGCTAQGALAPGPTSNTLAEKGEAVMVPFTVDGVRLAGFDPDSESPLGVLIENRAGLEAFYAENRVLFGLDGPVVGEESAFLAATAALDDAFFETGTLVLVLVQEGSGGVRHEITALRDTGEALEVVLQRTPPPGMAAAVVVYEGYLLKADGRFPGRSVRVSVEAV